MNSRKMSLASLAFKFDRNNNQSIDEEDNLHRLISMRLTTRTVSMLSAGSINLSETKPSNLTEQETSNDFMNRKYSIKSIKIDVSSLGKTNTSLIEKPSFIKKRYIILALCMMMNALSYTMRTNINLTIVEMVKDKTNHSLSSSCPVTTMIENITKFQINDSNLDMIILLNRIDDNTSTYNNQYNNYFDWTEAMQGLIIGAYYWGYIVTNFNGGQLSCWIGTKLLLFISLTVASLLTLTTPFSAFQGPWLVMVNRILIGFAQGVVTPAVYQMLSCWTPKDELGLVFALILASGYVGAVVAMPLCAVLSESGIAGGWPFVFYFFGALGLIALIPWWFFVFDSPEKHPTITNDEYVFIKTSVMVSKSVSAKEKKWVPWGSIIKSKKIWAISVAKFCNSWGNLFLMSKLPNYLSNVLNMSLSYNSFVNSSIYVSLCVSVLVWGRLSDFIEIRQYLNRTASRKLFESISLFGSALFLALIPVLRCDLIPIIVLLNLSMITLGFCAGGDSLSIVDVAPDYSGSIYGFSNSLASLPGILAPSFVGLMLNGQPEERHMHQWSVMFWIAAGVYAFGGFVFLLFVDAKAEKWGRQKSVPSRSCSVLTVSKT